MHPIDLIIHQNSEKNSPDAKILAHDVEKGRLDPTLRMHEVVNALNPSSHACETTGVSSVR